MSTSFDERISALVDDELSDFELRRVTDEVLSDEALKARYQRYVLMGDAMRDELPEKLDLDFTASVMSAIEDEEATPVAQPETVSPWRKPLAGAAIAASVAVIALAGLQTLTGGGSAPGVAAVAPVASVNDPASVVPQSPTQVVPKLANTSPAQVLPASKGLVTTVSAEQPIAEPAQSLVILPKAGGVNGYLTTHSEFASRPGVMSRIRVLGFEAKDQ